MFLLALGNGQTVSLPQPPQVRAKNHVVSLTLRAVNENGRDAFAFNGGTIAPVIRASPGDVLKITYINDLPAKSSETCAVNPCMNMTNLHFHGLTVSPNPPQDDVLGMLAMPGQVLHYTVEIPRNHPPGLFWYHTHPHGESDRQVLDGMSGAIVIEGMERTGKKIAVTTADGTEQTFKLTDHAVKDAGKDIGKGSEKGTKVIVYSSEDAGKKVAHFFEKM